MYSVVKASSDWLNQKGCRLDAKYYAGSQQKLVHQYLDSNVFKKPLHELTLGGTEGIFIPARFKRNYVENAKFGYPYITGSGIVQTDPLSTCKYLSRKYTENVDKLALKEKTTVITCSGNIGNTIYVSDYFTKAEAVGTPDLLRVIADQDKILPGYIHAFISSTLGKALITQSTYGSVIQHIEAHHLYDVPIPILPQPLMQEIHDLVEEAARLRTESSELLESAKSFFSYNLPTEKNLGISNSSRLFNSMLGRRHVSKGAFYHEYLQEKINTKPLKEFAEIVQIIIFGKKQMQCSPSKGFPLYSGSQMSKLRPTVSTYLHKKYLDKFKYGALLKSNWIVVSLSGTIGYASITGKRFENTFITDDALRIIPRASEYLGYLYAYVKSDVFQEILQSIQYGSVVQHINYRQVEKLPIPILDNKKIIEINELVLSSHNAFELSLDLENQAIQLIEKALK